MTIISEITLGCKTLGVKGQSRNELVKFVED